MDSYAGSLYFSHMPAQHRSHRQPPAPSPVPAFFLYGEAPRPPDEATVHVETIAARSRLHNWTIQPHRHRDLHQIVLVQSGRADVRLDDHSATLEAPGIVIVPPGVVHSFRFAEHTVGLVTTFATGLARDVAGRSGDLRRFLDRASSARLTPASLAATDIDELCSMLLREFERSAGGREAALRGLLSAWVANVYRVGQHSESGSQGLGARERHVVARFREAIESRFRQHTGIASYCQELGVSESQLRRACLKVTGQPPVALIHLRMLVEAERQLRYTAMSVAQIAYYLGFEDPAYFTRFFSQRTGASPKAFRGREGHSEQV
ncbi:MAG TPA: helix-turn-helix domain-containing protein [Steroidobacteraceae bacterium]|jgi:AraC family transcriptional activator of pobA|nr:helix-turn-helix domain-containing protein [Steroidobacteraceae bacterium]